MPALLIPVVAIAAGLTAAVLADAYARLRDWMRS